ncbi:MAG: hypothetical protein RR254_07955 [Muribaculaceae bacterium]
MRTQLWGKSLTSRLLRRRRCTPPACTLSNTYGWSGTSPTFPTDYTD